MEERLERLALLIEQDGIERLQNTVVFIAGVGGVGSFAAEALARSGVGTLILCDADEIALSNLNRQIHAEYGTVGMRKAQAMKERIARYAKECSVITVDRFFDASAADMLDQPIDYIVDAIDTLTSKMDLIEEAYKRKIPCISSLGMANRFDSSKLEQITLEKTSYDPLAKALRQLVKKRHYHHKIPVVFSREIPFVQNQTVNPEGETRKQRIPPASTSFVPAAAGLLCASIVVRDLLKDKQTKK